MHILVHPWFAKDIHETARTIEFGVLSVNWWKSVVIMAFIHYD